MIYDCFPFFNELDLLEVRLNELTDVVDQFVLVESTRTFSNQPKPLFYQENRRRFAPWFSRIIHVVVDDMPPSPDPWIRDHHQRNCILRGLTHCRPDDIILISDLDELPNPAAVKEHIGTPHPKVFQQQFSYYFLNNIADQPWLGTRMLRYDTLRQIGSPQAVRSLVDTLIPQGGWHFSFMGGASRIRHKLYAYAHQEYNTDHFTNPRYLSSVLTQNVDLFDREIHWSLVPDPWYPGYINANKQKFYDWIWEGSLFHENWYDEPQVQALAAAFEHVAPLSGDIVEIGCWEGQSTIALANACYPQPVFAVDTWLGNGAEDPENATVQLLRQRDVFRDFCRNVRLLTLGNVQPVVADSASFLKRHHTPIKFCHIDGSHDYESVIQDITGALRLLVPGGVICGDDIHSPGVRRAVERMLPDYGNGEKFWWWQQM